MQFREAPSSWRLEPSETHPPAQDVKMLTVDTTQNLARSILFYLAFLPTGTIPVFANKNTLQIRHLFLLTLTCPLSPHFRNPCPKWFWAITCNRWLRLQY